MKLTKMKVAFATILMVGTVFTACSGDDGEDGAQGPAGNANVSSATYMATSTDWILNPAIGGEYKVFSSNLTSSVAQTGSVSAFFSTDTVVGARTWQALPFNPFNYTYKADTVIFSTPGFTGAGFDVWFKVVTIPSSVKVDGVNENDFEELKAVYGLN